MLRRLSRHHYLVGQCRRQVQHLSKDPEAIRQDLRATRPSKRNTATKETVNYRYREGEEQTTSIASMWGKEEEISPVATSFVHFFDEVDAYMTNPSSMRAPTTKKKLSLENLFDDIDKDVALNSNAINKGHKLLLNDDMTGRRRSILDAFPLPAGSETPARSPTAFDEEAFAQYTELMLPLKRTYSSEVVFDWLLSDKPLVESNLPTLNQSISSGVSNPNFLHFRDELEKQRLRFMGALNITHEQYNDAARALVLLGRVCAKKGMALPVEIAWEKIKEAGVLVDDDCLSNYMYVLVTYGIQTRSEGPLGSMIGLFDSPHKERAAAPPDNGTSGSEGESQGVDVAEEVAAFHDNLYNTSEQSLTVRVKAMVRKGQAKAASNLLDQSNLETLRLRTFQPILKLYIDRGEVSAAISLFKRMREAPGVVLEAETYVQLIAAVAENGFLLPESPPIEGCLNVGFKYPSGPGLLDELVSMLAEDVLEVTPGLAKRLHTAISVAYKDTEHARDLEELHPLAPLQLDNKEVGADNVIASRVSVDANTGVCPKSGARLRLITLSYEQRLQLKRGLMEVTRRQNKEYEKKRKPGRPGPKNKRGAEELLENFANWLDNRQGKPFTAIIDGANVGFFLQNFDAGKFNFYQMLFMVQTLERMGEMPLVVLPEKFTRSSFPISKLHGVEMQKLDDKERSIIDTLWKSGNLYVTPPSTQDDHFWMIASISEQERSRGGRTLDVLPDDPAGRWPGIRPMLVSNDQMRDHKLELIEPRLFRRWYSSHIVNYNFTGFVNSRCVDDEILFSPADFFSREIQGNQIEGI
ncbi:Protein-only RNase P [Fragilaria crotonensis]|nr:Protein-only RNase P [Fragilaria crotonensis]